MFRYIFGFLFLLGFAAHSTAQTAVVQGTVRDSVANKPLDGAYIFTEPGNYNAYTGENGQYRLEVPANKSFKIIFSYVGRFVQVQVDPLKEGEVRTINARIQTTYTTGDVEVNGVRGRETPNLVFIRPKDVARFSGPSGNLENFIKTLPGVSGNNELSSGFNVRGGNYDENLIYVNEIEIYRPQLIRQGQQEGQSFINPDLVENISFSAGGFQAKYGDKLSSVLDVSYREPDSFATGMRASLLGVSVYAEDRIGSRLSYTLGSRYRTNAYLFGSLDVQGNYKPRFMDIQALVRYEINSKTQLSYLGGIAQNQYQFVPESQTTSFGTVSEALQLTVFFNGGELMRYTTSTNALTLKYTPNNHFQLRLIGSAITSNEREFYTVEGAYRLDELDKDLGSSTFGQAKFNRGAGYFINHARNELMVAIATGAAKMKYAKDIWDIDGGLEYRYESIYDRLNEWVYNDSVDYS
ncbi:MAG: TonB-dependent receptor, partial [Bacteroidota bacterium]|nr:TonB-dependent receptor [Bacteroidota bacterium]MDX5431600.1 TonB-dependent receptor [Bacteroidota bacterium]MDX5470321.1 TonB-dependent receptor [Bacteroidota bacterium]